MSSRKLEISSSWHVSELHVGGASFCATDGFVNQHRFPGEDGEPQLAAYCPDCAEREFGVSRGPSSGISS